MTQSLNSNISSLVTACNNVNVQASLGFTPLVVEPFVAGQLFADNPNSNAINPVVQQIVSFLNQMTYILKPDVTQVATTLGITPAQLNNNFNNPYNPPNPDLNNNIKKTLYAPTVLTGSVSGLTVALSWTSNSKNQTGYNVYRSTDNVNFSIINSPTGTTYNDTTPSAATYYYKVSAYNSYGESAMSNIVSETTIASPNPVLSKITVTYNSTQTFSGITYHVYSVGGTCTPSGEYICVVSPNHIDDTTYQPGLFYSGVIDPNPNFVIQNEPYFYVPVSQEPKTAYIRAFVAPPSIYPSNEVQIIFNH